MPINGITFSKRQNVAISDTVTQRDWYLARNEEFLWPYSSYQYDANSLKVDHGAFIHVPSKLETYVAISFPTVPFSLICSLFLFIFLFLFIIYSFSIFVIFFFLFLQVLLLYLAVRPFHLPPPSHRSYSSLSSHLMFDTFPNPLFPPYLPLSSYSSLSSVSPHF